MLVKYESQTLEKAMAVGRENHWRFRPVATAKMIEVPLYINEGFLGSPWWFVPEEQDNSLVPYEATRRVEELKASGVNVVGTIVAHEAPKLLVAPPKPKREISIDWDKYRQYGVKVAKVAAAVTVAAVAVISAVAIAMGYLLATAVMVDPCLIAVIETENGDHIWLEVASWF